MLLFQRTQMSLLIQMNLKVEVNQSLKAQSQMKVAQNLNQKKKEEHLNSYQRIQEKILNFQKKTKLFNIQGLVGMVQFL